MSDLFHRPWGGSELPATPPAEPGEPVEVQPATVDVPPAPTEAPTEASDEKSVEVTVRGRRGSYEYDGVVYKKNEWAKVSSDLADTLLALEDSGGNAIFVSR